MCLIIIVTKTDFYSFSGSESIAIEPRLCVVNWRQKPQTTTNGSETNDKSTMRTAVDYKTLSVSVPCNNGGMSVIVDADCAHSVALLYFFTSWFSARPFPRCRRHFHMPLVLFGQVWGFPASRLDSCHTTCWGLAILVDVMSSWLTCQHSGSIHIYIKVIPR